MDQTILTTSLEALIQRATSPQNRTPDKAAMEAFCGLIKKEPECATTAAKLIIGKVQSLQEAESLQALSMLNTCMENCGSSFHAEVGKFKFLNELIKLVSPKYYGSHTPSTVQSEVLNMLQNWTHRFPKESKIKEAYQMLKKQGVVKEDDDGASSSFSVFSSKNRSTQNTPKQSSVNQSKSSLLEDEEKSRLLQKLLQSKNPDDLQAANRLIKTMVKEEERRVELNCKRIIELEGVFNNVKLLMEMLDSYVPEESPEQDLELIKELYSNCLRFRPNVFRLAADVKDNKTLYNEVLTANDALGRVFDKYAVKILGQNVGDYASQSTEQLPVSTEAGPSSSQPSLLDLTSPIEERNVVLSDPLVSTAESNSQLNENQSTVSNGLELLCDIFGPSLQPSVSTQPEEQILPPSSNPNAIDTRSVLDSIEERSSRTKGFDDLDILGETLLKQNLPSSKLCPQFNRNLESSKVPMNQLSAISKPPTELLSNSQPCDNRDTNSASDVDLLSVNLSDFELNVSNERESIFCNINGVNSSNEMENHSNQESLSLVTDPATISSSSAAVNSKAPETKPLSDIFVPLETIKPGSKPPITLLDEVNGVTVVIHLAMNVPRPDVSVFVVTTVSKNENSLSNFLFQPVVPKGYRLRLQPASSTELPPFNPFLPPAAITQVMLIASSVQDPILFKFVLSYTMDGETITEMGEIQEFPLL